MNVDPEVLRRFTAALSEAGVVLREIEVPPRFATSVAAVPGTDVGAASGDAATATTGAVLALVGRMDSVAAVAAGAAQNYEVTEADFTAGLAALGGVR